MNLSAKEWVGLLEMALAAGRRHVGKGRVAEYIPELARVDPGALGVAVADGAQVITAGECDRPFTLQSVSKVFSLLLALELIGEKPVFERVGMEPTGDPFNSILKLELLEPAKPLNPMINAGALAVCSLLVEECGDEALGRLLDLVRLAAGNDQIGFDERVYRSEAATGDRNRALAYFLKDVGAMRADVEHVLELYFRQCSIAVNCSDVARMGLFLARKGRGGERWGRPESMRIVNTFLVTCGMYNASGEFAIRVGVPAKSGVSGAILALVPGKLGIGVFGPALDDRGNSVGGVALLEALSKELDLSIF